MTTEGLTCGDCDHEGHEGAVCIVMVDMHMPGQGDGEGECMCGATHEEYMRWSISGRVPVACAACDGHGTIIVAIDRVFGEQYATCHECGGKGR